MTTHEQWFKDFAGAEGKLGSEGYKRVLARFQYADQVRDCDLSVKEELFLRLERVSVSQRELSVMESFQRALSAIAKITDYANVDVNRVYVWIAP